MSRIDPPDIVEHLSPLAFADTVERIEEAITRAGLLVFWRIDHAAAARGAGLEMPPATVLTYGHPKGGTPVMLAAPLAALDLPLRVLVRQRPDGQTAIAFRPVVAALRQAGAPNDVAARLEPVQRILVAAVTP